MPREITDEELADLRKLDDVVRVLGLAESEDDPAEVIEKMQAQLRWHESNLHTTVQAARGDERQICADMARSYALAISKGTFQKPASVEAWGEAIAKHIEIPF